MLFEVQFGRILCPHLQLLSQTPWKLNPHHILEIHGESKGGPPPPEKIPQDAILSGEINVALKGGWAIPTIGGMAPAQESLTGFQIKVCCSGASQA